MSRTPKKRLAKLQFYENHIAPWNTNAVAIGTTAATVTTLTTKTTAARAAYNAQQAARQAAEAATDAFYNAVKEMNDVGQGILKAIDTQASVAGNPDVYALAEVPAPSTPTSQGDPGTPFGFAAEIGSIGQLIVKWKNSDAVGAVYQIYRRFGETGSFVNIGGVGTKKFTDYEVPAGTAQVQYQIQAVRSTGKSQWGRFTVNLGVENGMSSVVESEPSRLAA